MDDSRTEIGDFLRSRRDRITPEDVGLPSFAGRRVPGLRRHEVAVLAGVSVEYYTRLERGKVGGVSDSVLDSLSSALRLDQTGRAHLYALARAASSGPRAAQRTPRAKAPAIRPALQRMVDAIGDLPVVVTNYRFDILLTNRLGTALYSSVFDDETAAANTARFVFLSPASHQFYVDWETIARTAVGALRVEAAKNPYDKELSNLIGELSTRSDAFRVMWGAHDVALFQNGIKRFHHPAVGRLELDHESMVLRGDDSITVAVYSAPAESATSEGLTLLGAWAATELPAPANVDPAGR